jgi:beta-phosphoglucomutase
VAAPRTRAVFFDFDGTLFDSMPVHIRAWKQILSEIGIVIDDLYLNLHEGEKAEDTVARLLSEHGKNFSTAEQAALIERKRALYRSEAPRGLIPAARTLIEELRGLGVECDIATGSNYRNVEAVLPTEELQLFTHIISADDYDHGKPLPDPYLKAVERAGFPKEQCLVLENAPLGIESARAAGLRTIAITTTLPPDFLRGADQIIHSFEELLGAL